MGKWTEQTFSKWSINSQEIYAKMFNIFSYQGNTNQNYVVIPKNKPISGLLEWSMFEVSLGKMLARPRLNQ
jgi:hypothetical protein